MADTHTRGPVRSLPSSAWVYIETADHILHAGDVVEPGLLDELGSFAPLTVVMGNCDALDIRQRGATDVAELELEGVKLVMVHDAGAGRGRRQRLRARWPDARAVVFGHSHLPINEDDGELLLFNPGSPTWKRRAPFVSMGLLWIDNGAIEGEIFPV